MLKQTRRGDEGWRETTLPSIRCDICVTWGRVLRVPQRDLIERPLGETAQPGGFKSPAVSGASHVMEFNERDLTSDAARAGHGLGRPGPGPGLLPPIL